MDSSIRIGIGHDTHRLVAGGPLRLGGIDIDFDAHLDGHSDADVVLHAITDAILGAASLGDIGEMFPDTDPSNKNKDSGDMLAAAYERVVQLGWRITNLDCVVLAERPKILPIREKMIHRICELLVVSPTQIGIKGKTGEGLGDIGQGKAIQAMCVCLLHKV